MKACESYKNLILLADSGELEKSDRSELLLHLVSCRECRQFQTDAALLSARAAEALEVIPPAVNIPRLAAQARNWRRRVLRIQISVALSAAAALFLAVMNPGQWLFPVHEDAGQGIPQHLALLDEWQFWLVSYVGQQEHETTTNTYRQGWNEQDFARHLLVLEGLLPEEESGSDEESPDSTPGGLPPITLRGCNRPELLRS